MSGSIAVGVGVSPIFGLAIRGSIEEVLLLEDGFQLLLEDGFKLLLE